MYLSKFPLDLNFFKYLTQTGSELKDSLASTLHWLWHVTCSSLRPMEYDALITIRKWKWSRIPLFATPWAVAYQAPPSMEFCRHEYWSGLPFPSPGDLPVPGIKPKSSALQADTLPSEPPGKPMRTNARAEDGITLTQTVYLKKREKWFLKKVSSIVIKKEWE